MSLLPANHSAGSRQRGWDSRAHAEPASSKRHRSPQRPRGCVGVQGLQPAPAAYWFAATTSDFGLSTVSLAVLMRAIRQVMGYHLLLPFFASPRLRDTDRSAQLRTDAGRFESPPNCSRTLSCPSRPLQRSQLAASTPARSLRISQEHGVSNTAPFRPCRSARLRRFTPRRTLQALACSHSWGSYPSGSLPTRRGGAVSSSRCPPCRSDRGPDSTGGLAPGHRSTDFEGWPDRCRPSPLARAFAPTRARHPLGFSTGPGFPWGGSLHLRGPEATSRHLIVREQRQPSRKTLFAGTCVGKGRSGRQAPGAVEPVERP